MHRQQYGQLLLDAIRETLEIMAFAEVVPYSITVDHEELVGEKNASLAGGISLPQTSEDSDGWGTSLSDSAETGTWGSIAENGLTDSADNIVADDTLENSTAADNVWGTDAAATNIPMEDSPVSDAMWSNPLDAWGENAAIPISDDISVSQAQPVNFDQLMNEQDDWCWSYLKVNSSELDKIWFLVSKKLAIQLAQTMYAGDNFQLDAPILRDIIAELTNVLGGRLMLLLENVVGKFTLEVPQTGTGRLEVLDGLNVESVLCKVLVDGVYPVVGVMCFREDACQKSPAAVCGSGISD
ncbi:MAG: hypothetical protein LBT05_16530 [Planctomycetaceae bacterium]|nr:hypothetical protein [Planctomycetaceae bacterium]